MVLFFVRQGIKVYLRRKNVQSVATVDNNIVCNNYLVYLKSHKSVNVKTCNTRKKNHWDKEINIKGFPYASRKTVSFDCF